jgi:hypothetical protein
MPIFFDCTYVCDAEGCENTQSGVAELQPSDASGALLGLLGMSTEGKDPFVFRYDTLTGLEWVLGSGKAACSPPCLARIKAAEKEEQAPGGSGRPLKVVGDDEED